LLASNGPTLLDLQSVQSLVSLQKHLDDIGKE
jgi:hypothetical protein